MGEVIDKGFNFMQHGQWGGGGECLLWPRKVDKLNALKEDILLTPIPASVPGLSAVSITVC